MTLMECGDFADAHREFTEHLVGMTQEVHMDEMMVEVHGKDIFVFKTQTKCDIEISLWLNTKEEQ